MFNIYRYPILALFAVFALPSCADKVDYFPDLKSGANIVPIPAPHPANKLSGRNKPGPRVRVMPVGGVSAPMAHLLARSVVKNLLELRVSAVADSSAGAKNDYVLSGKAEANWKDERAPFTAIIRWTLVDGGGKPAASFIHGVRATWWQWQNGAPQVISIVGISAAKPVADLLAVKKELPAPPELMDTKLIVRSVRGAPGDGNHALMQAIIEALRATDVSVTEDPRQAVFVLDGVVSVSPDGGKMEKILIEWTVRTINGRKVGKSSRHIRLPGGRLDPTWGRIALQSGIDAVADIEEIITGNSISERSVLSSGPSTGPLSAPSSGLSSRPPSFQRSPLKRVPGRALPPPL